MGEDQLRLPHLTFGVEAARGRGATQAGRRPRGAEPLTAGASTPPRGIRGAPGGRRVCPVDRSSGAYEGLDVLVDVPDVDVHARRHAPPGEPERDELAPVDVAAEDTWS